MVLAVVATVVVRGPASVSVRYKSKKEKEKSDEEEKEGKRSVSLVGGSTLFLAAFEWPSPRTYIRPLPFIATLPLCPGPEFQAFKTALKEETHLRQETWRTSLCAV